MSRDTLHQLAPPLRGIGLFDPNRDQITDSKPVAISTEAGVEGAVQRLSGEVPDYAADAITPDQLVGIDPIAATEVIAYDFLARGGKHSRPFITLAAYDALTGGESTCSEGESKSASIPDAVRRAALSIETFHKASLVHDDIEDDDSYRYGQPAVHHRFGVASAINVGDYLIGMGYRLLSRNMLGDTVDAETRVDLLDSLAAAHVRLSEGQGAELLWRDAKNRRLAPIDARKFTH